MPLLGLSPDWSGIRLLGGWGMSGNAVSRLELAHRPILDIEGPGLRVEVAMGRDAIADSREEVQFEIAAAKRRNAAESGECQFLERDAELVPAADLVWSKVMISVEGEPVPFEVTRWDQSWAAIGNWEGVVVTVRGTLFPTEGLKLAAIGDVEPYIEGSRQMKALRHRQAEKSEGSRRG